KLLALTVFRMKGLPPFQAKKLGIGFVQLWSNLLFYQFSSKKSIHITMKHILLFLVIIPFSIWAQTEEYVGAELSPSNIPLMFKTIDTEYIGGNDSWRSWYFGTDAGRLKLYMPYSDAKSWQSWQLEGEDFDAVVKTVYSSDNAWKAWEW